jgi:hypothetical protein
VREARVLGATVLAMLLAAGTPDLAGRAETPGRAKAPAPSMPTAVQLGAKWGVVTSVHRTPERNRLVGGAPNSFHLRGRAIDIARRPGVHHGEIDAAFRRAGYVLLESLDEGDHSHFAFGLPGEGPSLAPAKVQLAAAEPAAPALTCPVEDPKARRRPDRSDGCAAAEPDAAPRLRPLENAP